MENKLNSEQIRAAASVLYEVVTNSALKLKWGGMKREELRRILESGGNPSGYRVEWLRETRKQLIDTLTAAAHYFNSRYAHDRISAADMTDALQSTLHQFTEAIKRVNSRKT